MTYLSIAVMHHAKRAAELPALLSRIHAIQGRVAPVQVVEDVRSEGIWPTAKRAWAAVAPGATHHMVIQDDVLPCLDFTDACWQVCDAVGERPISFYANRQVIEDARAMGARYATIPDGVWGQAFCMPVNLLAEALGWCAMHVDESFKHDDERFAMWCLATRRQVWCTAPSLVEHLGAADSLVGQSNKNRVARWFAGETVSGLFWDWRSKIFVEGKGSGLSSYVNKYGKFLKQPLTTKGAGR